MKKNIKFLIGSVVVAIFGGVVWHVVKLEASKTIYVKRGEDNCWRESSKCKGILDSFDSVGMMRVNKAEKVKPITSSSAIRGKYGPRIDIGEARPNFYLAEALFHEGENVLALKHLRVSAEIGLPEAQYKLGELYSEQNDIFEQDLFLAYVWYLSADRFFIHGRHKSPFKDATVRAEVLAESLSDEELGKAIVKIQEIEALGDVRAREFSKRFQEYYENQK